MSLKALGSLLEAAPQYGRLRASLERPRAVSRVQVLSDAVPFTLANLWVGLDTPTLVVTPRAEDARRLHEQLVVWSGEEDSVVHFPETDALPFERLVSDADTVHQRLRALSALADPDGRAPIVVASAIAVAQKTLDR